MLRHENIKTTSIYLQSLLQSLDETTRSMADSLMIRRKNLWIMAKTLAKAFC